VTSSCQTTQGQAYSVDEVPAAIEGVYVAIEVVDMRIKQWQSCAELWKLADNQINAALIIGSGVQPPMKPYRCALRPFFGRNAVKVKSGTSRSFGSTVPVSPLRANSKKFPSAPRVSGSFLRMNQGELDFYGTTI
jgi:2-keto-4-pentenoate hydratase